MSKLSRRDRMEAIIAKLDVSGPLAVKAIVRRLGLAAFTDEALEEIACEALDAADFTKTLRAQNRAAHAARRAASAVPAIAAE